MSHSAYIMMYRTQISLDAEMRRRAGSRADQLGISLAEYIRTLIARDLDQPSLQADPSALFDLGTSEGADVAARKDQMIGEAVQRPGRKRGRR